MAGSRYDFAAVLHAVLEQCEHRRRALAGEQAAEQLQAIAAARLAAIAAEYREGGGSPVYGAVLEEEVLRISLPQYLPAAVRQTALEQSGYGVWRQGDVLARALFALAGLTVGGAIVALPFIPIFEEAFAFLLALGGFLYPEIRKLTCDYRHAKLLNRLLREAAAYQASQQHFLREAALREALEPLPEPLRVEPHAPPGRWRQALGVLAWASSSLIVWSRSPLQSPARASRWRSPPWCEGR